MNNVIDDIYPMPSFPTLEVRDLAVSTQWYQEVLGFRKVFTIPGPDGGPVLTHLRWAKYADLLLRAEASSDESAAKGVGITLTFAVSAGSVDDVAERARRHGAHILAEPQNQPWNTRDVMIADPDGFRLVFTQGPLQKVNMDQIVPSVQRDGGADG